MISNDQHDKIKENDHWDLLKEVSVKIDALSTHNKIVEGKNCLTREFTYDVRVEDDSVELISLLTQCMRSYEENLSQAERFAVVEWFTNKYGEER